MENIPKISKYREIGHMFSRLYRLKGTRPLTNGSILPSRVCSRNNIQRLKRKRNTEGRKQKESGMQNKVTEISWQHEKKRFEFLEI